MLPRGGEKTRNESTKHFTLYNGFFLILRIVASGALFDQFLVILKDAMHQWFLREVGKVTPQAEFFTYLIFFAYHWINILWICSNFDVHRQVQPNNLPEIHDNKIKLLYAMSSYSRLPQKCSHQDSESAVAQRAQLTSVWESGKQENAYTHFRVKLTETFSSYCDGLMCSNHEAWVAWTITLSAKSKLWVSIVFSQKIDYTHKKEIKATLTSNRPHQPCWICLYFIGTFLLDCKYCMNSQTCCRWQDLKNTYVYTFSFFDKNSLCSIFSCLLILERTEPSQS